MSSFGNNSASNIVSTFSSISTYGMTTSQASNVASSISSAVNTSSVQNGEWTKSSGYLSTCWWKNATGK